MMSTIWASKLAELQTWMGNVERKLARIEALLDAMDDCNACAHARADRWESGV